MAELFAVDWPSIRSQAVESFGEAPPHAEVEDDVIRVFEQNPRLVMKAISDIAADVATGKVRSGWRVLRSHVQKAQEARSTATVDASESRDRKLERVRQSLRTAGCYLPSPEEFEAAVFGVREQTASVEFLTALEEQTRGAPGRRFYEGLLLASIVRTSEEGTSLSPETSAPLELLQGDRALRGELASVWLDARTRGIKAEDDEELRAAELLAQRARMRDRTRLRAEVET